jgi:GntR family transcriptional regulator/MocR family aminotransferase
MATPGIRGAAQGYRGARLRHPGGRLRPGDIVVTHGAQQAFDLIAKVLVEPGRTVVALEEPGYPPMRGAFAQAGAVLAPVAVDEDGLVAEAIPPDAAIVCVTPSHQFPLGAAMSPARRQALLAFAERADAVIVEDDYDGEFRFETRPLDALQTLDRAGRVIYVGTFSKSLSPDLRLGFAVCPPWALDALARAKQLSDWNCAVADQEALAEVYRRRPPHPSCAAHAQDLRRPPAAPVGRTE